MFEDLTPRPSSAGPDDPSGAGTSEPDATTGSDGDGTGRDALDSQVWAPGTELEDPASEGIEDDGTDSALADWKDELRAEFERWLASIDEVPDEAEEGSAVDEAPDLFSFYEELAVLNVESRKANRRSAEAVSQWAETLGRFDRSLEPLRATVAELAAARAAEGRMSNERCLMLVEVLDRLLRLAQAFATTPAKSGWWGGNDDAWRKVWKAQREGFDIVVGHLEALLQKEGVTRIRSLGQPFDPAVMMAVALQSAGGGPVQRVVEEVTAGYLRDNRLLRAAQVKVAGGTPDSR